MAVQEFPESASASSPVTFTIAVPLKNVEHSQVIPIGTKQISVQLRKNKESRIAFVAGKVAGPVEPYATIKAGAAYNAEGLDYLVPVTLYIATKDDAQVVEIVAWS